MKKTRLDISALEVDSFHTSSIEGWEGTVHGAEATAGGKTQCGGIETCGEGCGGGPTHGDRTQCGGVHTCGDGCGGGLTHGGKTHCGGVLTCGDGCHA